MNRPHPRIGLRGETSGLLLGNALTLAVALWKDWPVSALMWPFWIQSVVIGALTAQRMLKLRRFSTKGMKFNRKPVAETASAKRGVVMFFLLHYGLFHAAYFVVLVGIGSIPAGEGAWVLVGGVVFAFFQFIEQPRVLARDARGKPNLGTMMSMPYLRVVPMHLAIAAGAMAGADSRYALVFFSVLKTAADVGMALVERAIEARSRQHDRADEGPRHDGDTKAKPANQRERARDRQPS